MWIRRITVENWRGLDADLPGLAPGLNLICGPNESGKSRLVQALRFALFESSSGRSQYKRELEPWGVARGKPRVRVDFTHAGSDWQIEKVFLDTGYNTQLRGAATSLEGRAAEDRLADLLGAAPGGRAEIRIEDAGIWSLLWVDQGRSREIPAQNPESQTRLQQRLGAEIGEVAAGESGQRILALAEEQRNRFFTAGRGEPRGILKEPEQQLQDLEARLLAAVERRDRLASDADDLDDAQRAERDLTQRVGAATARLNEITQRHREVAELDAALKLRDAELRNAESERARCTSEHAQAAALSVEIERLRLREQQCVTAQDAATQATETVQREYETAQHAVREVETALQAQEADIESLRRRQALAQLHARLSELTERRRDAHALGERITTLRVELAALPVVSADDVEALRSCQDARAAARARLDGASASLELRALRDLRIGDTTLAAGTDQTWLIEDEQRIELDGIGILTIRPGGGELERLRDAYADAERTLAERLTALRVANAAEAQRIAQQRHDREQELQRLQQELERRFPEGRDEIDSRLRELTAQYDALRAAVAVGDGKESTTDGASAAAHAVAGTGAAAAPFDPAALEQAQLTLRATHEALQAARARRDLIAERRGTARDALATANADLANIREQHTDARQRRAALPEVATLEQRVAAADRAWQERLALRETARERFEALGGSALALELEQAIQARKQLQDSLDTTRDRRIRLEETVRAASADGRHEAVLELEAERHAAAAAFMRLQREAAAARRLHEVLQSEYGAARERLTRPVIERIRPYLSDLFPGSEAWLDDELNLLGLRSREQEEAFEALSGGAREQLSLLVRVGLAEVIGADDPFPLVLDDVLVNTDAERIQRVQRLLYQAARRMQILLFTCHGPLFDALGPDLRVELPERPRRLR